MTPVSAIPGHLRLLVLWARESFVQSLPHAQASIPPREAAAAHTGPAHSQRCQTSLWALCGWWKQSQLTLFSVSLYFPNSRNLLLKQHEVFFNWLTPSQHLALSARWWNSTGQWSAGKPVPAGLQRSTSPTAICTRPLESPHSALFLPKLPRKCAHHSLTSLSPELALAACSACLLGQLNSYAEHCGAGEIPGLWHMFWRSPCGHPSWAGSPTWLQQENISCSLFWSRGVAADPFWKGKKRHPNSLVAPVNQEMKRILKAHWLTAAAFHWAMPFHFYTSTLQAVVTIQNLLL